MKIPIHPYSVYNSKEASSLLGVKQITIQRYIKAGKLPATKFGKVYRVTGQALLEMMSLDNEAVRFAQDRSRQIENTNFIKSRIHLLNNEKGLNYLELFDLTAQTLIASLNPDYNSTDKDQLTLKYIGSRVFNTAMTAYHAALSGYYQNSFSSQRDLIEIQFLTDYFRSNPEKIEEWRESDNKARYDRFSPGKLREHLDKRDGFLERKREQRYKQFCEYAAHVTYPGFKLLANANNQIEIGSFYDESKLMNTMHELCLNFGYAVASLCANIKIGDANSAVLMLKQIEKFDKTFNFQVIDNENFKTAKAAVNRLVDQLLAIQI